MTEIIKDTGGLLHNFMIFEYSDVEPSKSSDGIVTMKGIIQTAQGALETIPSYSYAKQKEEAEDATTAAAALRRK